MNNITTWDYQQSIEKVRPMVINWRNLTVELVEELYTAREKLSASGRSWMSLDVPNGTPKTWNNYLVEIGLPRTTVHRWLERYEPEERRILEPEEVEERKQIELRSKQDRHIAIHKRVLEAINTGRKPLDWDDETEKQYGIELKERKDRQHRIEQSRLKMEEDLRRRQEKEDAESKRKKERQQDYEKFKQETDFLNDVATKVIEDFEKKKEFKQRIKLSQSGESDLFIDALMDYLEELPDDNRRIEACNNIVKVCRNISIELQRMK